MAQRIVWYQGGHSVLKILVLGGYDIKPTRDTDDAAWHFAPQPVHAHIEITSSG